MAATAASTSSTKANAKGEAKTTKREAIDVEPAAPIAVLDETPKFRRGRAKSELREAIENLGVDQSLDSGYRVSGESPATKEDTAALARVRLRCYQIQKSDEFDGHKYRVRTDVDNRIVVTRTA